MGQQPQHHQKQPHQQQPAELQIVFIYDCFKNESEEDDPLDSIIYFHPEEISVEKRIAICGQLMGVTQFLAQSFSLPTIITLQNGKFAIRPIDTKRQYILALGCSSGVPDWLLQKQATLLQELFVFFHGDLINSIITENKRSSTTMKLDSMLEQYVPLSQCNGDVFAQTFGILPVLHLPKSASTIPLQATILLHTCMTKKGVLGGVVMYQTKVIGVEMGQALAQKLAFIQPYKTPPAESVPVDFKLPLGVQLIFIYITEQDLVHLNANYSKFQEQQQNSCHQQQQQTKNPKEIESIQEESIDESLRSLEEDDQLSGNDFFESKMRQQQVLEEGEKQGGPLTGYRKSLEDISSIAVRQNEPNPALKRSTSIADPLYPYIYPNGKCLTLSLVNTFNEELKPVTDENVKKDGDEEEIGDEIESNKSGSPTEPSLLQQQTTQIKPESSESQLEGIESSPAESASPIRLGKANTNRARPKDLPILSSKTVGAALRKKQRVWKTFDDMLSPNDRFGDEEPKTKHRDPRPSSSSSSTDQKEQQKNSQPGMINESVHQRLVTSFRKLSTTDDYYEEGADYEMEDDIEFDDEKQSSTTSNNSSSFYSSSYEKQSHIPKTNASQNSSKYEMVTSSNVAAVPNKCEKTILFMYSVGSMRLQLVIEASSLDGDLINSLWDYSSTTLTDLKEALTSVVEDPTVQFSTQSNPYCFLNYDSVWKSLVHGGRNEVMDFSTVQEMHQDFITCPQIHELVVRNESHAVYGYQCVGSEVYYQQSSTSGAANIGPPMPTDLMGKVPLKAKRRLERDHSILLL